MIEMTKEELEKILQEHKLWISNKEGGKYANLRNANLSSANLRNANLSNADLRGVMNIYYPFACPEKGSFIGFKKSSNSIVELLIPEDALRSSATSRKCRCSKAKVLSITNINGDEIKREDVSDYDNKFVYRVWETVEVEAFDMNRWNECSTGIHFFITREEAVRY